MFWERDAAGEATAAAPVNSAPVLRERVNRFPLLAASLSFSPRALFLLLFPAVNCLAIADAIKTEMCLQSLRSPPSSQVPLPACEEEGAAGRGKQLRSPRWLVCPHGGCFVPAALDHIDPGGGDAGAGAGMSLLAREGDCLTPTAPKDANRLQRSFLQLTCGSKHVFSFAWGHGSVCKSDGLCVSLIKLPRLRKTHLGEAGGGIGFCRWSPWSRTSLCSPAAAHVLSQPCYSCEMLDLRSQAGPAPQEDLMALGVPVWPYPNGKAGSVGWAEEEGGRAVEL